MKVVDDELFIHFILFSTIIAASLHLTCCSAIADRGILCHENEKQALLRFKHMYQNSSIPSQLSSWEAEVDCCSWESVVCNNITGHVVELSLNDSGLTGELDDHFLLSLTHLTYLDLSYNDFQGALPRAANITKLQYFDISNNDFNSIIPEWLFHCKYLQHLDLNVNGFQGALPRAANITKLQYFDISDNYFNSTIPDWLYECKHLELLYASGNSLQGSISNSIGNLTYLKYLDLYSNMLFGEIPNSIGKLCVEYLDLSRNKLGGDISHGFANMSACFLQSLEQLDLSNNKLSGLPSNLGKFVSLSILELSNNKFTGNLPESMGQLFNLKFFNISINMLEGIVTETHFANLTNLKQFFASGNRLSLKVSDNWIPNFSLWSLGLGSWNLGRIPVWLDTQQSSLGYLDLSNTGIADQIPSWFSGLGDLNLSNNSFSGSLRELLCVSNSNQTFSKPPLYYLNLEGNLLSGELPDCFMKHPFLSVLNLGNNNISGRIPESIGNLHLLQVLNLLNNRLSGQIPSSVQNCTNLWKIDLSSNQLIGKLPSWMGTKLPSLYYLILRSNKLAGTISSGICRLSNLRILDLSDNKFSGKIPNCMDNFTAMASSEWINQPESMINIVLPRHESATVSTKGTRLYYDTILSLVTNIDLSSNNFSGDIPKQLASLTELRSLNLSRNHLNGKIPDGMEGMKVLESLDLSNNLLSGNIPQGIVVLSSLNYLDLSYNNLSGEIPQSTQFSTFNASSFVGNNLCGPPLTISCNGGEIPARSVPGGHDKDGDGKSEIEWLYVFVSLGYAVGLAVVCNLLVFKKSWRDAFFGSVDNMWNKLFAKARKERSRRG